MSFEFILNNSLTVISFKFDFILSVLTTPIKILISLILKFKILVYSTTARFDCVFVD